MNVGSDPYLRCCCMADAFASSDSPIRFDQEYLHQRSPDLIIDPFSDETQEINLLEAEFPNVSGKFGFTESTRSRIPVEDGGYYDCRSEDSRK